MARIGPVIWHIKIEGRLAEVQAALKQLVAGMPGPDTSLYSHDGSHSDA